MSYTKYQTWRTEELAETPDVTVVIPAFDERDRIVPTIGAIAAHMCSRDAQLGAARVRRRQQRWDGRAGPLARTRQRRRPGPRGEPRQGSRRARRHHGRPRATTSSSATPTCPPRSRSSTDSSPRSSRAPTSPIASRAADGAARRAVAACAASSALPCAAASDVLTGVRVKDTQCGFKLFTRESAQGAVRRLTRRRLLVRPGGPLARPALGPGDRGDPGPLGGRPRLQGRSGPGVGQVPDRRPRAPLPRLAWPLCPTSPSAPLDRRAPTGSVSPW